MARIQTSRIPGSLLSPISSSSITSSSSRVPLPQLYPLSKDTCSVSCSHRYFSSSPIRETRLRAQFWSWLNSEGAALRSHSPGRTNYLTNLRDRNEASKSAEGSTGGTPAEDSTGESDASDLSARRPFPLNPSFVSEPILSEALRNAIYERVVVQKKSVRSVSVDFGVDMRRVGAVVRLVELERRWREQGKSLALPYARAVHEMVPTTPLAEPGERQATHESINDLPVHRLTEPQIFYPVSESRQFTRVDAGRVFSGAPGELRNQKVVEDSTYVTPRQRQVERVGKGDDELEVLRPADERIPHPHLIAFEKDRMAHPNERREVMQRYKERLQQEEQVEEELKRRAKEKEEQSLTRVVSEDSRFEFRFKDVVVSRESVGPKGRGAKAPGRRYGVPSSERKKGQVKIPTKVEV